jgi:hypothetical protein
VSFLGRVDWREISGVRIQLLSMANSFG